MRAATSRLRAHRSTAVLVGATALALAVAVLLGGDPASSADHDPDNPGPTGSRAVAEVLRDGGVDVEVARSADELAGLDPGPATTVLVTSSDALGESTAARLLDEARGARLVVAGPGPGVTEALGVSRLPVAASLGSAREAACTGAEPSPLGGLRIEVDDGLAYPTGTGCFPAEEGWLVATTGAGLTLLGVPGILENDQVLRADNAAAALRLLGQEERLVWYVPDLADLVAEDGVSLRSLLPPWLAPGLWLLGLATVAAVWWRARRLGPLAVEPLPVTVRAIEATQARGRLYRRAGDRAHAARVLRRSTLADAARHLRAPPSAEEVLVREVARRTGRPLAEVQALVAEQAPPPATDDALIRLASELAELDREVHRT